MGRKHPSWGAEEDALFARHRSNHVIFKKLRARRTLGAIKQRRYQLRHPEPPSTASAQPGRGSPIWTPEEVGILERNYQLAENTTKLRALLPRFTTRQIRSKAHTIGLKRWFMGSADVKIEGHNELVDQIRLRAKHDGIALTKLDQTLGTGRYFSARRNWEHVAKINLGRIARAVEFFGGTLVIDWRDR